MRTLTCLIVTLFVCITCLATSAAVAQIANPGFDNNSGTGASVTSSGTNEPQSPAANWKMHPGGQSLTVARESTTGVGCSGNMLHVTAMGDGSGVHQVCSSGTTITKVNYLIKVISGRVRVKLTGSQPEQSATTQSTNTWEEVKFDVTPGQQPATLSIYSDGGGSEYYIDMSDVILGMGGGSASSSATTDPVCNQGVLTINKSALSVRAKDFSSDWQVADPSKDVTLYTVSSEEQANNVLAMINNYSITNYIPLGTSVTVALVNMKEPSGAMSGEDCTTFNGSSVTVGRDTDGSWKVKDGSTVLGDFGSDETGANNLQCLLKGMNFTNVCTVRGTSPTVRYYRR